MEFFQPVIDELSTRPLFWILSITMLVSAFLVVTLKNIFHSSLFLILCLFTVSGLFVLLEANFLAGIQFIMYAGSIAIFMVLVLTYSKKSLKKIEDSRQKSLPIALISAVFSLTIVSFIIMTKLNVASYNEEGLVTKGVWIGDKGTLPIDNITLFCQLLVTDYLLPFSVLIIVLISTFIGVNSILKKESI